MNLKKIVETKKPAVTKSHICESVATRLGLPVSTVKKVVNETLEVIIQSVASNHPVQMKGFATFSPRYAPEYKARNPQTDEAIVVPEKVLPSVRFGEPFKRTVRVEFGRRLQEVNK